MMDIKTRDCLKSVDESLHFAENKLIEQREVLGRLRNSLTNPEPPIVEPLATLESVDGLRQDLHWVLEEIRRRIQNLLSSNDMPPKGGKEPFRAVPQENAINSA